MKTETTGAIKGLEILRGKAFARHEMQVLILKGKRRKVLLRKSYQGYLQLRIFFYNRKCPLAAGYSALERGQ